MISPTHITQWTEILTPPRPYLHALRRSFPSGLHVVVLTQEINGILGVLSAVDHGTPLGTCINEGSSTDPEEIAALIALTCEKWDSSEATMITDVNRKEGSYHYARPAGGISEAVSRED